MRVIIALLAVICVAADRNSLKRRIGAVVSGAADAKSFLRSKGLGECDWPSEADSAADECTTGDETECISEFLENADDANDQVIVDFMSAQGCPTRNSVTEACANAFCCRFQDEIGVDSGPFGSCTTSPTPGPTPDPCRVQKEEDIASAQKTFNEKAAALSTSLAVAQKNVDNQNLKRVAAVAVLAEKQKIKATAEAESEAAAAAAQQAAEKAAAAKAESEAAAAAAQQEEEKAAAAQAESDKATAAAQQATDDATLAGKRLEEESKEGKNTEEKKTDILNEEKETTETLKKAREDAEADFDKCKDPPTVNQMLAAVNAACKATYSDTCGFSKACSNAECPTASACNANVVCFNNAENKILSCGESDEAKIASYQKVCCENTLNNGWGDDCGCSKPCDKCGATKEFNSRNANAECLGAGLARDVCREGLCG